MLNHKLVLFLLSFRLTCQAVGGRSSGSHRGTSEIQTAHSGNSHPPEKNRKRKTEERRQEDKQVHQSFKQSRKTKPLLPSTWSGPCWWCWSCHVTLWRDVGGHRWRTAEHTHTWHTHATSWGNTAELLLWSEI